ncbi:MAG: ribonuclease J, partial [Clostridia bacterium]|nr:ribonuclease J [Clostridia bacterium]
MQEKIKKSARPAEPKGTKKPAGKSAVKKSTRKPAAKKPTPKKPAAKKPTTKKPTPKKPTAKKGAATKRTQPKSALPTGKLRVIPLGGLDEIGKNMTLIEYENDMILIDSGMAFPDEDMPGIDLVIPDFSYLAKNRDKLRGVFITHGHEDHIGSLPYLLKEINVPVYGTRLTLGLVRRKLAEHRLDKQAILIEKQYDDVVKSGCFAVEFVKVNHSIADACAFAVHTPLGTVVHMGDFKIDTTPIRGKMIDLARFGELGRDGVLLMMSDSTNAERPGYAMSEKAVGKSFENIFNNAEEKRIIVATFSSNIHRVQQIINAAVAHGRKVALSGRSM